MQWLLLSCNHVFQAISAPTFLTKKRIFLFIFFNYFLIICSLLIFIDHMEDFPVAIAAYIGILDA